VFPRGNPSMPGKASVFPKVMDFVPQSGRPVPLHERPFKKRKKNGANPDYNHRHQHELY
jgi:transcription antitermination factor NusG